MIADRRFLAASVEDVRRELDQLSGWIDNPDGPFPGDAIALGELLHRVAGLMLAGDDPPAEERDGNGG